MNDYTFWSYILDISCYDNCLYSSYKGANARDDSGMLDYELHDIIMRHFLCYLETNEWHRYQECIAILKEIDICIARFELKESEKAYRYNSADQASTVAERAAIVKQRTADCEKACRKALDIFAIDTWPNSMDNIIFLYKWRVKLAKRGFYIKSSLDFVKALKADYNLMALNIQENIPFILGVILSTIENEDC